MLQLNHAETVTQLEDAMNKWKSECNLRNQVEENLKLLLGENESLRASLEKEVEFSKSVEKDKDRLVDLLREQEQVEKNLRDQILEAAQENDQFQNEVERIRVEKNKEEEETLKLKHQLNEINKGQSLLQDQLQLEKDKQVVLTHQCLIIH